MLMAAVKCRRKILADNRIIQNMSGKGNCYGNTVTDCFPIP